MITCSQCGEENPERARFCLACGSPLSAGCPTCGEENPPHARFCLACGTALGADARVQAMPRELRKIVTVVFCDVTGSTTLGERLDPESLRRVMGRYFDEMKAALERHGGTVEKFIGDAVMAVFGIPSVHEDDALRAVRAAAEMRRERDRLNEELERTWGVRIQARIGVNTGEVVAGDAAAGQRFATGDTVNVAARLEQAAAPGEILIGEDTYLLVRDAVRVEPVEPLTLKGKAEPVPAFRLLDVDLWAAGYSRRLDSPLVGRRDELVQLRAEYDALLSVPGARLVTVIGAAGLGKSRLTNEFLGSIEDALVLRGRCLSYGDGVSFWPVMEIVRAAAEIEEADSIDAARAKIARLLRPDSDEGLVLERVAAAVGLGEGVGSAEETFWGVRKLLEALAAERPVVVLIDDGHWAAPAMLDLIDYVTGWSGAAHILLVCLARPELLDARPSWPTTVALGPLAEAESAELLANLAPELDEPLRKRILETAEGNPLYIEQLAALIRDDETHVQVPPSIHALVAARLDRLQTDERATIERGAIEGKVFHRGAVQHLTPEPARPGVPANLLTLVRKELIGPDEALFSGDDAFRFRNLVVRDAAYEAMPKQARAELHERFASWLEAVGERAAEYDEIVAHHLEQAHRYLAELGPLDEHGRALGERAADLYARSAIPALGRGDMTAARFLYERAVSLYPDDDPRRIALLPELGATLREAGDFAAAEAAFAEADSRGDRGVAAHAAIELAMMKIQTDPVHEGENARLIAEDAIPVLEELDDELGLARAWKLLAIGSWLMAHAEMASAAMEKAIAHARRAGNRAEEIDCVGLLAFVALHGPMPVSEAWRFCDELAEYGGLEASVLNVKGALAALGGAFDEGRELQRRSVEGYEDLGFHLAALALSANIGRLELEAGDARAAETEVRQAADALLELGERGYASTLLAVHAEAVYQQGRFEEAAASARQAMELTHEEDVTAQVPALGVLAKVAAQNGRRAEAEELALSATARMEASDFLQLKGAAFEDLAEVLDLVGKGDEARAARARALELYEQKECVVVAARVRERLAAVSKAPSTS